jgi:hypothetical protein
MPSFYYAESLARKIAMIYNEVVRIKEKSRLRD